MTTPPPNKAVKGRIILNCEQCTHFRQKWDLERWCNAKKQTIEQYHGIPAWCPWPEYPPRKTKKLTGRNG